MGAGSRGRFRAALGITLALVGFAVVHGKLERQRRPLIEITDQLKNPLSVHHYLKWNSHSRVAVTGDPEAWIPASGWGLSDKTAAQHAKVQSLVVTIDTFAATPLTRFDGDVRKHQYLKDDVTNMAHHLRQHADVGIVGVGGGRDVLSAIVFGQNSVFGVELNENVLGALTGRFSRFAGHIAHRDDVYLVHDEARSRFTRTSRRFDVLQLSLIDTFAATAAGAFVLSENGLYTADAWETFLRRLNPRGILTVSRWFYPARPAEALRLAALARESLHRIGVDDARKNVLLVKAPRANGPAGMVGSGVANILVSPSPFSAEDLSVVKRETARLGFEIVVSPEEAQDPLFAEILTREGGEKLARTYPLDLSAPTDDRPFFFHMLRLTDIGDSLAANFLDPNHGQLKAVRLLAILLVVVFVLTIACLVVPLLLGTDRRALAGNGSLLAYFFAIGLGFMFVEMSSMQRLMVLLGHPTYALSVVLFTLLVGTGIGSALSPRVATGRQLTPHRALGVLVAVLTVFGLAVPALVHALAPATNPVRIAASMVSLFGLGLLMGLPFPLGMRAAAARAPGLMPWLWGLNGAASVLCTVVAAAISLHFGIGATLWCGVACYGVALLALPRAASA
jgi:hypothetical protein